MSVCKRKGNFGENEYHKCFILGCDGYVHPKTAKTCPVCNFKKCEHGHCACDASEETRYALDTLYKTYCEFCADPDSSLTTQTRVENTTCENK